MISLHEAQELHELIGVAMIDADAGLVTSNQLERARELAAVLVSDAEQDSGLTEPEKELLTQMISDYFDGLGNSDIEQEQPELYQELASLSDSIETKLGLK